MGFKRALILTLGVVALVSGGTTSAASAHDGEGTPAVRELASFAAANCTGGCGSGSTVGPDGALYVTNGKAGTVLRIDPTTGATTTLASGLPIPVAPIGGAMDVAFIGNTAYVLVTLVGPFFGQTGVVDGIYRIQSNGTGTPIADIGAWATAHPPATAFAITTGVQYAMQPFRGGFLVTDGHHNRVLRVKLDGTISQLVAFGDIVPTGLALSGNRVYMSEAGPVPHRPQTGKVVTFKANSPHRKVVASGAPLLVDVEFNRNHDLFALSQGVWDLPNDPNLAGQPASHNTGKLVRLDEEGGFTTIVGGLDQPTSLEFIGKTAFVVTLTGKVMRIDNVSGDGDGSRGSDDNGD
jgi:sugar lactone lactonase YvrE